MEEQAILDVKDLSVGYGKIEIVHQVSFQVQPGEMMGVLGRNGMGKTTLFRGIMGLTDSKCTKTDFYGKAIHTMPTYRKSKAGLAYVPQGKEILPDFTVEQNLEMGAYGHDVNMEEQKQLVLSYFPALNVHMARKGGVLSGGLQQQLAIGRALMSKPGCLLLDEPTEGIQPNVVNELAAILKRINREMNMPILVVEQNLKFVKKFIQSYIILQKGEIVTKGRVDELTDDVARKYLAV